MPERDPLAAQQRPRDPPAAFPDASPAAPQMCVVGIGASAGGLEACRRFLAGLPAASGMAFILIQHLDPTHDSMLVGLLSNATAMKVMEAADGMEVQANHLYIIPPGLYLSLAQGRLSLTAPLAPHGARLPFDFLLQSLAAAIGHRAACVILSGGGADGSIGARAIKAAGGLVIAQAPAEAAEASMPESVIATGAVDAVLPAAEIAGALLHFGTGAARQSATPDIAGIIALLKSLTAHDFTLYKSGTMERRIARRMSLAGYDYHEAGRYLGRLRTDEDERNLLVNDLLINVTNFFRDPKIFELLAAVTIPELVGQAEGSIRLWVAGCSTGEETYSLAMLLLESIEAKNLNIKLQIFATDMDAEAIQQAREGVYTSAIEKDVSPARLAKFFIPEEGHYRVSPALRGCVIFAVQDVLADPPFSKLNMVSCRNLLIYLQPQAQERIISVFNFALRAGGYLLLGAAETVAAPDRRFEQISKPARLYRKLGAAGSDHLPAGGRPDFLRLLPQVTPPKPKLPNLVDICRKLLLDRYAPPAILVNARLECLYTFGAADKFMRGAAGSASHDLLAQLPSAMRGRMRDAVTQAAAGGSPIRVDGGRVTRDGVTRMFHIEMQAMPTDKDRFLVCFIADASTLKASPGIAAGSGRMAELEAELAATRSELEQAVQELESASKEHNAVNDEALSVNEEFQSTNEELLTSKEELQSLNEELTALNSQLQETLERSRMTSADLRNVLYSTDVPTLFLDQALNIRFFTPSTTLLFHLMPTDIGRKLADFRSLAIDPELLSDAAKVLLTTAPASREIQTDAGIWYQRHVQPYRTFDGSIGGVVITFTDINDRKAAAAALQASQLESERANIAKTRFLAAASHDLRQPLQTMVLINGLLEKTVTGTASHDLVKRLDHTMQSITTMLNAMLDINQIEAGIVKADITSVDLNELFERMRTKFADQASEQNNILKIMPSHQAVDSDPALLEQILINLIGNALKYTKAGRVLLGARRHAGMVRIEVWDTGIGIEADQLKNIFDEYHQINNAARVREFGLGLGLSIVQRLADLLGHTVTVHSTPFKGSVFAIDVPVANIIAKPAAPSSQPARAPAVTPGAKILVIEDDPDIRQLLAGFLTEEGYVVAAADDGPAAQALVASGTMIPDLIIADYNLPGQETGLRIVHELRIFLRRRVPVIICTGDISTVTLRLIADEGCVQMNKPMKLDALMEKIQDQLWISTAPAVTSDQTAGMIYVVDDDPEICDSMRTTFEQTGMKVATFPDSESFLASLPASFDGSCLLVDAVLPGISGLQLLQKLKSDHIPLPAIMLTGHGEIAMAVQAINAGAIDFLEKPINAEDLLAAVRRILSQSLDVHRSADTQRDAAQLIATLTLRQRQVMDRVLAGEPSKNIAADLGISQRTVENHRAAVMVKTGAKSIPALARLAVAAIASN